MLQFYFLSVLLNAITGYVLLFAVDRDSLSSNSKVPEVLFDETFRLVLGILTALTGFFKLLTVVRGDIPVIGDLLPALAGLAGGITLLYEFYKTRSTFQEDNLPQIIKVIVTGQNYIGIGLIACAILHFLFPTVLFL